MPKTAQNTAETIEFPSFDTSKASDQFRAFTEKGVAQGRETYSRMKAGFEDSQKALESTYETAKTYSDEMTLKSIAAMRASTEASFSHLEALVGAKSLSDIFELQSAFLRKGMEMSIDQAKEMQTLSTKAATELSQPMKNVFEKSMKELKAA